MIGTGNNLWGLEGGFLKEKGKGDVFGNLVMLSIPTPKMPARKAAVLRKRGQWNGVPSCQLGIKQAYLPPKELPEVWQL